jgi:hypothetical protein
VLQFGDGARGWLGVEVLFQDFVEAVEFAAVCRWYGREHRYLTPSSPSIGGQGCVRVELGDGQPIPMHGCCLLEARRGEARRDHVGGPRHSAQKSASRRETPLVLHSLQTANVRKAAAVSGSQMKPRQVRTFARVRRV